MRFNEKNKKQSVIHFDLKNSTIIVSRKIYLFFLIFIVILFFITIGIVDANTLNVPEDYPAINSAINAASSGDSIIVHPGIYHENIIITKNISLKGEGSPVIHIDNTQEGILVTAKNAKISGFRIINSNSTGILVKSDEISLNDLDISDTNIGIKLLASSGTKIRNISIKNSIVNRKNYGIYLSDSQFTTISNNYLENIGEGISLDNSSRNNINNNVLKNCSLRVIESYNNIVKKNIVNDKPLEYFENQNGGTITNAGQVILIKSENITIKDNSIYNVASAIFLFKSNNISIINNTILRGTWGSEPHEYGDGILLNYSSAIIKNNIFKDTWEGIQLSNSYKNEISDNTFINNNVGILIDKSSRNHVINNRFVGCGIDVDYSYNNDISRNIVNGKPLVYLENKRNMEITGAGQVILVNSQEITIKNNRISRTTVGIKLWNSTGNIIINNILSENTWGGISLWYSPKNNITKNIVYKNDDGIHLAYSFANTVQNNTVTNNRLVGISLLSSPNNEISYNVISDTGEYGIAARNSQNNIIYFNDYVNNPSPLIIPRSSPNSWNSTNEISYIYNNHLYTSYVGNYFSNFAAIDRDNNGISDRPHGINPNNIDYYPMVKPLSFYML